MKKILILGGGFGGVETFHRLHKKLHPMHEESVSVELINRSNYFTFTPMLHEAATGSVAREQVVQPLREMLACCGKDFHQSTITKIDLEKKIVHTDVRDHSYDILVIALGVEQGFFGTPGAAEYALALKWLKGSIAIRNRIIRAFEHASEKHDINDVEAMRRHLHFIIVGGGATGTELAGQLSDLMAHEMKKFYGDVPQGMSRISLVHAGERLLEQLSPKGSEVAQRHLESLDVNVLLQQRVVEVTPQGVLLASGETLEGDNVFWTAGTESTLASLLPKELLNERSLLPVETTFQVPGHPDVFAVGDSVVVKDAEYSFPPTAQAAVQAARIAAKNIYRSLTGEDLQQKKFRSKGDIIPLGDWFGIYEHKRIHFKGRLTWIMRRGVFLTTMYSWTKRFQVLSSWMIGLVLPRDTSEF